MSSELEQPACAEDELARACVSIIATTRRHWATKPDRFLPPEASIGVGLGYAALTRDGEPVYEDDGTGAPR